MKFMKIIGYSIHNPNLIIGLNLLFNHQVFEIKQF